MLHLDAPLPRNNLAVVRRPITAQPPIDLHSLQRRLADQHLPRAALIQSAQVVILEMDLASQDPRVPREERVGGWWWWRDAFFRRGGGLRAAEEGSLGFDRGLYGMSPGGADALGGEEVARWEVEEDEFEEFGGGEDLICGGYVVYACEEGASRMCGGCGDDGGAGLFEGSRCV